MERRGVRRRCGAAGQLTLSGKVICSCWVSGSAVGRASELVCLFRSGLG